MTSFYSESPIIETLSPKEQFRPLRSHLDEEDGSHIPTCLDGTAEETVPEREYKRRKLNGELASPLFRNGWQTQDYAAAVRPTISSDMSSKKNDAFHGLFPEVPTGDYLVYDYGCKLQRGITIGGRLYLSKSYICFFSNLDKLKFVVPLQEVVDLVKDTTGDAPNAIRIYTRTTKHTFTSFLKRDTAYNEIHSIWCTSYPKLESRFEESVYSEDDSNTSLRGTSYPIQPANDTPLGELPPPPFTGRQRKTPIPQLAEGSMTMAEFLHKTSDSKHPPLVSTASSTCPSGNNLGFTDEGYPNSVQIRSTTSASIVNQYPSKVAEILQPHSPQQLASVMYECLVQHGCLDLMSLVDPLGFSSSAVAEGGLGDIWTGKFHGDETKLAIKVLRFTLSTGAIAKKELKRTAREIYNWSKLDHENIHKLKGVILFRERLGMVSEWMEHGNLRQYLSRNHDVDRHELCVQIARGVAYLHGVNMIHGDLKACNILVSPTGIIKITDFDYSIASEHSLVFSTTTRIGGGTLRWMAPELLLEDNPPQRNAKTDIYALGMTFLETITNKHPYSECGDNQIYRKLAREEHPKRLVESFPENEWGSQMWNLLLQCWNFDSAARPIANKVLEVLLGIRKKH